GGTTERGGDSHGARRESSPYRGATAHRKSALVFRGRRSRFATRKLGHESAGGLWTSKRSPTSPSQSRSLRAVIHTRNFDANRHRVWSRAGASRFQAGARQHAERNRTRCLARGTQSNARRVDRIGGRVVVDVARRRRSLNPQLLAADENRRRLRYERRACVGYSL